MIILISAKKWKRISIIIIAAILVFCTVSLGVTKLVYDSIFARYEEETVVDSALSTMVEARSIHTFVSGDNLLTGYYYAAQPSEKVNGLVVFVPGFHAGGDDYLWQIQSLLQYGWGVFTFDPTGSFRSQGKNQIGFSQAIFDLEAALKYVENNRNFGYNDLVLMGHSRGGYAVCCAVAETEDVDAVVSIAGINSAMEGIMYMSADAIGPIAYGNYGFLWLYQAMLFGGETLNREAAEIISQSNVPTLVIHGTGDTQVPTDECSIISHKEEITASGVEYLLLDGGHTDLMYDADGTANDALMASIQDFLLRSLEKK